MGNLNTSWIVVWAQVIYLYWGPMSSCVKSLKLKIKDQSFNPHTRSFIHYWHHFFSIFASSLKLNFKSQTTMDEHKHKILVTFMFFMAIFQVEKIETPFIIHKQAHKLNKRRGK
jgi:hypothetical protein